jgi:YbbR domain-containing protein
LDKWLEKDITIRVLSIVLALTLWFQVTSEQNPLTSRTFKSINLNVRNLDKSLVLVDFVPKTITVTLQGQRRAMSLLEDSNISAGVDLKAMEPGKASLPIDVTLPNGVQLVEVLPGQASITADTFLRKKVKVEVRPTGNPAEDYAPLTGVPKVTEATVEGAKSRVALVVKALVDVDITGATGDVIRTVPLRVLDVDGQEIKDVQAQPKVVEARVPMRKLPPAKMVTVKPETQGPTKEGFKVGSLTAEPQTVKIRAPQEALQKITAVSTRPIDVTGVSAGFDRQVDIVIPPGVSLVEPKSVQVKVSIVEDRAEKTIAKVPVTVRNASTTFSASVTPAEVSVTIEGLRVVVEKVTAKSLEVFVDALGLFEGEFGVNVQVVLPNGINLTGLSSDIVKLTLKRR